MTRAPENLKAARAFLLEHLDIHENSRAYPADLDPAEVGIVGDVDHRGGYHCGRDRLNASRDYSVVESARDRGGLTDLAAALDVGWFEVRVAGKVHNLRTFSVWLVAQCKANMPDTQDIREVIYSPDGKTVKRWDRLRRRATGDSSHLTHSHLSYFRDAIKAGRGQTAVFRRYLTEIGLLAGTEDDMAVGDDIYRLLHDGLRAGPSQTAGGGVPVAWIVRKVAELQAGQAAQKLMAEAILTAVRDDADRDAILARIDARAAELTAEVTQVPGETVEALGTTESTEEIANRLRAVLGDRAQAVGQLLATAA